MKISIITSNASPQTFVRAKNLYNLLKDNFEIEVISVSNKREKAELYKSTFSEYKKINFDLGTIVNDLKKNITGDVIYALKARPTSFGFAMSLKNVKKLPVVVDIDSREIYNTFPYSNNQFKNFIFSIPFFNNTNSFIYTWILEKRIKHASQITVASPTLQRIYGGTFIPSACDTDFFDSSLYKRAEIRESMGWNDYKIILYSGSITRNTDFEILVKAVKEIKNHKIKIVVVGDNKLKITGNENIIEIHHYQPQENIAKLLSASDIVVVPQKITPSAFGEIPVKLFEAMSAEKIIIAPDIYDFPDLLMECGLIYKIDNFESLKENILKAIESDIFCQSLAKRAREKCIDKYSKKVISNKLFEFFSKFENKVT